MGNGHINEPLCHDLKPITKKQYGYKPGYVVQPKGQTVCHLSVRHVAMPV